MGDTGSLLLGLVNAILVIHFISTAGDAQSILPISAAPAIGFSILILPLFDTLRVFAIRILSRRSPFSPDRNHIHHLLLDYGLTHSSVTYICVIVNILFIVFAYFSRSLGTTVLLLTMLLSAVVITGFLIYNLKRKRQYVESKYADGHPTINTQKLLLFRKKKLVLPEDN